MSRFGSSVDARKAAPQVINWYLGYMEFIIETNGNYLYLSHTFICLKYCGAAIDMWQLVSNTAKPRVENMAETSN